MDHLLLLVTILFALIVIIGFVNEKVTHLTYEIALLLFSVAAGCIIAAVFAFSRNVTVRELLDSIQVFNLREFLIEGVLCFMLFAGSRNQKIHDFRRHVKEISVLSFVCTLLSAVFYGVLFFLLCMLLHLSFTFPMCLMLGSIVAPTDPIAATSILKQFGLPEKVGFLMEAESLLNDGVGVALFVCFSGMVKKEAGKSFLILMGREILGAVLIGAGVCWLCFQVFIRTMDIQRKIASSLLMVSLSYLLSEAWGCSGAIACVACGICFSTLCSRAKEKGKLSDIGEFDSFWETADVLLNSLLYVMLGLTFVRILQMPMVAVLSVTAIVLNLVCRFGSIYAGTWLMLPLPDGYSQKRFAALFTWGGLRGGLSIALAMGTAAIVPETHYYIILGSAYAIVFFTTVVQGLSMKKIYRRLSGSV